MKKILSFVFSGEKFLALYSEPHPDHGEGGWFVVTGGVEDGESFMDAVKREVKEETNLEVLDIMPLNWGSVYEWGGEICEELNFIAFVKQEAVKLNEEHSKFEWLNFVEFVDRLRWDDDKELLKQVLKKALKKKKHFKDLKIKDYRKNGKQE